MSTPEKIMTSKERITRAFACEEVDRVPWVPFVGCHAGALLDVTATQYLQSEDHIVQGVTKAVELYQPDGIPIAFDLQIEAEALGCDLSWAEETPPAVRSHPLANGTALGDLKVPGLDQGRIPLVLNAGRRLRQAHPDIALYGLITGPFTLALHLQGTDIFMKMFDSPADVKALMAFCTQVCLVLSDAYLETGCDVIAVVDPMTSQIGPDQFVEFITPSMRDVFAAVRRRDALSSFFVCGHAQQNIPAMCECKPDNVSVDENIPLDYVRDECLQREISFGGNMQLTSVLLLGTEIDSQKNAIACMETAGQEGFILAPGCDIPYATPVNNLKAVAEVVTDPYKREVTTTLATEEADADRLNLEEYGQADKVVVDIITLDSEACAPCQYMVDAVRKVAPEFEGIVQWREHKIKYRESLVFMASLMVRNVPTICIDGQITFVSRIPPRDELIRAIQKRINEKLRLRIRQQRAHLLILGGQGEDVSQVADNIDQAVRELGMDVAIERIDDLDTISSYGVSPQQTPAVVLVNHQIKSVKRIPEVAVVKEWLKIL